MSRTSYDRAEAYLYTQLTPEEFAFYQVYLRQLYNTCDDPTQPNQLHRFTWFRDVVFQSSWRPLGIMDAYAHAQIATRIADASYGILRIPIGAIPGADSEIKHNCGALQNAIRPFRFDVINSGQSMSAQMDGTCEWYAPIRLRTGYATEWHTHGPWCVPLEIGTTRSMRTLLHLLEAGGIARWPYGDDHVTLIANLDPNHSDDRRSFEMPYSEEMLQRD